MTARAIFHLDRDRCIGSGLCLLYAPQTFAHDDDTKVVVIDSYGDPAESIRTAVEACPTRALSFTTDQGEV